MRERSRIKNRSKESVPQKRRTRLKPSRSVRAAARNRLNKIPSLFMLGCHLRPAAPNQYWQDGGTRNSSISAMAPRRTSETHQKAARIVCERFVEFGRRQRRGVEAGTRCRGGSRGRRNCHCLESVIGDADDVHSL